MNISKVLLWITNILMVGVTLWLISVIVLQQVFLPILDAKKERILEGATSMSEHRQMKTGFFDLNYYFIYRNEEVLIDDYMISPRYFKKTLNYEKASAEDFLKVETAEGSIHMPNISEKLSLPISEEDISLYFGLGTGVLVITWLFFFIQLKWIRRLIKNTLAGRFFAKENATVFMKLAILYTVLPMVIFIAELALKGSLLPGGLTLPEGYSFVDQGPSFQFHYLFFGLILLLIAQAFRHGLQLQKEQELTI